MTSTGVLCSGKSLPSNGRFPANSGGGEVGEVGDVGNVTTGAACKDSGSASRRALAEGEADSDGEGDKLAEAEAD